jgi:hypothetical protein
MKHLDQQLHKFKSKLMTDLGLSEDETGRVCTTIASEVRLISETDIREVFQASGIPLMARYEELLAFQSWMSIASTLNDPSIRRAQVITQNYICFVYLKDSCFEVLARIAPRNSVVSNCSNYLTSGSVRHFRNGFAHANWKYLADFSGLEAWARQKAFDPSSPLVKIEI